MWLHDSDSGKTPLCMVQLLNCGGLFKFQAGADLEGRTLVLPKRSGMAVMRVMVFTGGHGPLIFQQLIGDDYLALKHCLF